MSGRSSKKQRREARHRGLSVEEVRTAMKSLAAMHLIEPMDGSLDDPDGPRSIVVHTPQQALDLAKADPNIYKTPAGNLLSLVGADGVNHWMSLAEAELWKINAEVIDRDNPGGTQASHLPRVQQ
jgi:hypothetical protein